MLKMSQPQIRFEELIETCCEAQSLRARIGELSAQLEIVEDKIREVIGLEDRLPGLGVFRRSDAYLAAIRVRRSGTVPSYLDEDGEILYAYSSRQYISKAKNIGVGRVGVGLVLLDIVEHQRVKRAIRSDQNDET
jgi:hypothetical protein